jgi:hypothetical protein
MNTIKSSLLKGLFFILIAGFILSCSKEEEEILKDYVGTWESEPANNNSQIPEKQVFIFTNNTFEVEIHQGATFETLGLVTAVIGDITNATDSTLKGEITGVSVGPDKLYVMKSQDPTTFASTFDASVGKILYESFTAKYEISGSGDEMVVIIPVKTGLEPPYPESVDQPFILTKK